MAFTREHGSVAFQAQRLHRALAPTGQKRTLLNVLGVGLPSTATLLPGGQFLLKTETFEHNGLEHHIEVGHTPGRTAPGHYDLLVDTHGSSIVIEASNVAPVESSPPAPEK